MKKLIVVVAILMGLAALGLAQQDPPLPPPWVDPTLVDLAAPTPYPVPTQPTGALGDPAPTKAATLLVPFFEVEPVAEGEMGLDTLVGVTNVTADPIVAHVVFWNVDSVPTIDFNIFMTGYDVATFSVRDIFNGHLPNNGCDVAIPTVPVSYTYYTEEIIDADDDDRFTVGWIDCDEDGMYFNLSAANHPAVLNYRALMADLCGGICDSACYSDPLSASFISYVRYMHTDCSLWYGTDNYTGYITIDVTLTCNGGNPSLLYYWQPMFDIDHTVDSDLDAGAQALMNDEVAPCALPNNALMGDWFLVDAPHGYAQGFPCVHVEAWGFNAGHDPYGYYALNYWGLSQDDFWVNIDGDYTGINLPLNTGLATFYGKFAIGWADYATAPHNAREMLALQWASRYLAGADFAGATDWLVWRSHNYNWGPWATGGASYDTCYSYFDNALSEEKLRDPLVTFWDEEENVVVDPSGQGDPSYPHEGPAGITYVFPTETWRYDIVESIASPFVAGWVWIDFATDRLDYPGVYSMSILNTPLDQAWVEVVHRGWDTFSVGYTATIIESHNQHIYVSADQNGDGVPNADPAIYFQVNDYQ